MQMVQGIFPEFVQMADEKTTLSTLNKPAFIIALQEEIQLASTSTKRFYDQVESTEVIEDPMKLTQFMTACSKSIIDCNQLTKEAIQKMKSRCTELQLILENLARSLARASKDFEAR